MREYRVWKAVMVSGKAMMTVAGNREDGRGVECLQKETK